MCNCESKFANILEQVQEYIDKTVKPMKSPAQLNLDEAKECAERGAMGMAEVKVLRSLQYAIGVFHPYYQGLCAEWKYDLITLQHGFDHYTS